MPGVCLRIVWESKHAGVVSVLPYRRAKHSSPGGRLLNRFGPLVHSLYQYPFHLKIYVSGNKILVVKLRPKGEVVHVERPVIKYSTNELTSFQKEHLLKVRLFLPSPLTFIQSPDSFHISFRMGCVAFKARTLEHRFVFPGTTLACMHASSISVQLCFTASLILVACSCLFFTEPLVLQLKCRVLT